jgi:Recombination enhancement, RecA-dependent nuclease
MLYERGPLGLKTDKVKDRLYIAQLHQLPCVICEEFDEPQTAPTTAHHTICGRFGQHKTPDREAIPLCHEHHQGAKGIHHRRAWWVATYGPDTDYIARTQDRMAGELNE